MEAGHINVTQGKLLAPMQSQMKGLQSRMSNLGQQINEMYKRAENSEELAVASLTARLQSSVGVVSLLSHPIRPSLTTCTLSMTRSHQAHAWEADPALQSARAPCLPLIAWHQPLLPSMTLQESEAPLAPATLPRQQTRRGEAAVASPLALALRHNTRAACPDWGLEVPPTRVRFLFPNPLGSQSQWHK